MTLSGRDRLLDLVTGARCVGCSAPGGSWCAACDSAARAQPRPRGGLYRDEGSIRSLVRHAKFGHARFGARIAATLAGERLEVPTELTAITWVPPDPLRQRLRGAHLPEQLARRLATQLQIPAINLLERRPDTTPQRGLTRAERLANVRDAFTLKSPQPTFDGPVLLVDDIRTTGATLDYCSNLLLEVCTQPISTAFCVAGARGAHT